MTEEQTKFLYSIADNMGTTGIEDFTCKDGEKMREIIKVLEQPASDDCVSRKFMYELGATCIATRDKNDKLIALGTIENLPPVTPTQSWIPVSERLPEEIGTYLVTLEYKEHGKGITTLWYHGEGIGWDLRVADVVIAWQPLPKPYEEKRGSDNGKN